MSGAENLTGDFPVHCRGSQESEEAYNTRTLQEAPEGSDIFRDSRRENINPETGNPFEGGRLARTPILTSTPMRG